MTVYIALAMVIVLFCLRYAYAQSNLSEYDQTSSVHDTVRDPQKPGAESRLGYSINGLLSQDDPLVTRQVKPLDMPTFTQSNQSTGNFLFDDIDPEGTSPFLLNKEIENLDKVIENRTAGSTDPSSLKSAPNIWTTVSVTNSLSFRAFSLQNGLDEQIADEPAGYGLYSYLLFGSNSLVNMEKRLAASDAYLRHFSQANAPNVRGAPRRQLNLFQAPLRNEKSRDDLSKDGGAQAMVEDYDYQLARLLLNKIDRGESGIYIVTYFEPLSHAKVIDEKKLLVQDLSFVSKNLIELWILEFRRQVRQQPYWDQRTFRDVMLRVRTTLPFVADLVKVTGKAFASEIFKK